MLQCPVSTLYILNYCTCFSLLSSVHMFNLIEREHVALASLQTEMGTNMQRET